MGKKPSMWFQKYFVDSEHTELEKYSFPLVGVEEFFPYRGIMQNDWGWAFQIRWPEVASMKR